jgi:von Willebrand factor type D domain.
VLRRWLIAGLLAAGGAWSTQAQAADPPKTPPPAPTTTQPPLSPAEATTWRRALIQVPKPKRGCFVATYPEKAWREVTCAKAPAKPYPPRHGLRGQVVGNGVDYSATTTGATIAAEGRFDSVTGVTSEKTVQPDDPTGGVDNQFSLQLNTQFFQTQTCNGAAIPGKCKGWEQFVVANDPSGSSYVFIQYWMLHYNTVCPPGWYTYVMGVETYCYTNSTQATEYPSAAIGQLSQMALVGTAPNGATDDAATLNIGGAAYSASGDKIFPDLGQQWTDSEFNIFGDCCGSSAVFNQGSTLVVQTATNYGSSAAPTCSMTGYTGETNNLSLTGTPVSAPKQDWPSITFNQTNAGAPTAPSCQTATSWGDTHIITFSGLTYDFQAAGQFLLLNTGTGFTVYANQVSGAPSWPNTSVNQSVSVQMGNVSVVVPSTGTTISVNGTPFTIANGAPPRIFGDGVQVSRNNTGYNITDPAGNHVITEIVTGGSPRYINAYVYPGTALTAQATGALVGRSSTRTITGALRFKELYGQFGKAWSVTSAAGNTAKLKAAAFAPPAKPFHAKDLKPAQRDHGLKVCKAAGVTNALLLDGCVLDVTVIGDRAAAAFTRVPEPTASLEAER